MTERERGRQTERKTDREEARAYDIEEGTQIERKKELRILVFNMAQTMTNLYTLVFGNLMF